MAFLGDDPIVAHNAEFDRDFLNHELGLLGRAILPKERFIDTLVLARQHRPGSPASLDAVCKRFNISIEGRELHGALKDARILADVYLAMSGGQAALGLDAAPATGPKAVARLAARGSIRIPVVRATEAELAAHGRSLEAIDKASGGQALFRTRSARGA